MADFIANTPLLKGEWTDITGAFAGLDVVIQNVNNSDVRIYFGSAAPTERTEGIILKPHNWPVLQGTVITQVWAHSEHGGEIHISEAS